MIAAYSSGVPVRRLLDAILGTSPATWICAKRPSAVKIKMPLGVSPNGNDFLPSGAGTSATTKFQVPTIWSLRLFAGCAAAAPTETASASVAAALVLNLIVSSPVTCGRACYPGTHRCAMTRAGVETPASRRARAPTPLSQHNRRIRDPLALSTLRVPPLNLPAASEHSTLGRTSQTGAGPPRVILRRRTDIFHKETLHHASNFRPLRHGRPWPDRACCDQPRRGRFQPDPLGRHRRLPGLGPDHSHKTVPVELQARQQAGGNLRRRARRQGRHAEEGRLQALRFWSASQHRMPCA